jgi:diguanylate cyclase (GGDEF)-like protein
MVEVGLRRSCSTPSSIHPSSRERVLKVIRALGFLAPAVVAICVVVVLALIADAPDERTRWSILMPTLLAAAAGIFTTLGVAWAYGAWRLDRLARRLEETLEADEPIALDETGVPAERRLARAFNQASRAFVQTEVRATHDRLTGVPNRETLLTALVAEVERAARYRHWLSVAFIDIDRFKPINDTYGHNAGDAVLRQIATVVAQSLRGSDLVGRYGGEEFMIILPETRPEQAVELMEQLRVLVMQSMIRITDGQRINVTISAGIAGGVGDVLRVETLVEQADTAMYHAKAMGRNRVAQHHDIDEGAPVKRAPISAERRAAAAAIGQWASATATEALASVQAPQPHHRGRPSDMIASLSTGIAMELNLPEEEIDRIRIASLLHDLGKLAVPSEILDKPSSLTPTEWQSIGEHPRIGQVILEQASSLRDAIPIVLHHHERYNGGGYPHGLRGSEIPLGARIVAVADAYHAMVHDRPYSKALSHAEALDELQRCAGQQFDPDVVSRFCALYREGVPPDGLDEVYRLHHQARGGIDHLHSEAAELVSHVPAGESADEASPRALPPAAARPKRRQRRTVREAAG